RVAAQRHAGEQPQRERTTEVHGERADREDAAGPRRHRAVEHEARDGADPAEHADGGPHEDAAHAIRTRRVSFVAANTAANPATMLAAAYAAARPARPWSSICRSSTCTVENVVSAPHSPVPSSGRR